MTPLVLRALNDRLLARPGLVLALALISAVPMTYWSAQLFGDLRADLRELLPQETQSVKTLHELERRFGGISELLVLIESPDADANRRFSEDLAIEMRQLGHFRSVQNRLGEEGQFFSARRHLYVETEDLEEILERIEDAVLQAKKEINPLLVDLDQNSQEEKLDLSDIEAKYASQLALAQRFPNDYFENKDGTQLVILARKHGDAFDVEENRQTVDDVYRARDALDPKKYHPQLTAQVGGDVRNIIDEHTSLVEDLILASSIVAVLLALVVVLYYRRMRSLLLIAIPLTVGCVWTFGISHFVIGYLNASSAFLGPIVPGNGINFGLILLARYIEERRRGRAVEAAIGDAVVFTAKATSTAALAASVAYGSLMVTDFLGFKHFGIIGGIGMILCWIFTFLVLPSLILWTERRWPMRHGEEEQHRLWRPGKLSSIPPMIVDRAPRTFAWTGLVTAVIGVVVAVHYLEDPFEKDFHKLRSTVSIEKGTAMIAEKVDKIFARITTPQVVMVDRSEDVPLIVDHLQKVIKTSSGTPLITEVVSIHTLVPQDQEEKIEVLDELRELLDDNMDNLDEEQKKLAQKHRPPDDLQPFTSEDLPTSIRENFRDKSGKEDLIILVTPNIELNLYHADVICEVADVLRTIPLPDGRIVHSSGNFVIYADMVDSVGRDGPRATTYAFCGLLILCLLAYRRISSTMIVAGTLLLGVAWLATVLELRALKINFLNFIALPITFGIGVDYAVNIYTRYVLEREKHPVVEAVREAVRSTGGAVVLCSLTTIIGYGSLLVARNGSLVSFGEVAVIGELTCLGAALFIMPSWIRVFSRKK